MSQSSTTTGACKIARCQSVGGLRIATAPTVTEMKPFGLSRRIAQARYRNYTHGNHSWFRLSNINIQSDILICRNKDMLSERRQHKDWRKNLTYKEK